MRSTPLRSSAIVLGIAILAVLSGCQAKTSSVNGKVTFEGKPITGGSVILYCQDKQIVHGIIGPDGTYSIPNVPHGSATVTVHAHMPIPAGLHLKPKRLPKTRDGDGPIPPAVDPAKAEIASVIPERFGLPEESGLNLKVDRPQLVFNIDLMP